MADAIARATARKAALDRAREALRTGSTSELRLARLGLPPNGKKAEALKHQIDQRQHDLASGTRTTPGVTSQARHDSLAAPKVPKDERSPPLGTSKPKASVAHDGIYYDFRIAETNEEAFFSVRRTGARVDVTVNSVHPFGRQLAREDSAAIEPAVLALLAAWARYELDQVNPVRQNAVRDARVDWGRLLRSMLFGDEWPQF